jgi:hypothetical protein
MTIGVGSQEVPRLLGVETEAKGTVLPEVAALTANKKMMKTLLSSM